MNLICASICHLFEIECLVCFWVDGLIIWRVYQPLRPIWVCSILSCFDLISIVMKSQLTFRSFHRFPKKLFIIAGNIVERLYLLFFNISEILVTSVGIEIMWFFSPWPQTEPLEIVKIRLSRYPNSFEGLLGRFWCFKNLFLWSSLWIYLFLEV